jgi:hypothetical protein
VSSIDKRGEALLTLDDLQQDGIAVVIANAVATAAACLPAAG